MVSLRVLVVVASGAFVTGFSPWSAAVVTAPALRKHRHEVKQGLQSPESITISACVKEEFQVLPVGNV